MAKSTKRLTTNDLKSALKFSYAQFSLLLWIGASVSFTTGCATPSNNESSGSSRSKSKNSSGHFSESGEFHDIEALFAKKLYIATRSKVSKFALRFPQSAHLPAVENIHGLVLLQTKVPHEAIVHFKRAIELNPSATEFNQYVLYNLATAQLEAQQINHAQETLQQININSLDKPNQIKVSYLKTNIYEKQDHPLEAARQLLITSKLAFEVNSSESKNPLYKRLDENLYKFLNTSVSSSAGASSENSVTTSPNISPDSAPKTLSNTSLNKAGNIADDTQSLSTLESLYQEFETAPVSDSVLFHLGEKEIASNLSQNGQTHLRTLLTRYPLSPYFSQATALLAQIQLVPVAAEIKDTIPNSNNSIGILLPTQGKFAKYGAKSIQALQLVFDPSTQLIVEDSGETPEQGLAALDRLVQQHHVTAVIGPLMTKGIDQISARAQELGVPLISLARRAGPLQDFVFQGGLTQQIQSYEIARYAIEKLHAHNFAIIYPNEKLGIEASQSFWDAVESMGGKIVGIESYSSGETDFRQAIDKLSGLFYTEARQREVELLAEEREANHIKKRTRKTEQFFRLRPIVDYDAVFIPDEPTIAGQILPTFAFRDIDRVRFLGTSSWNSPDFISRVQSHAEQASFVDAFFPNSSVPHIQAFIEKFKTAYHQEPGALEALAYDAGQVLKQAISALSSHFSRYELKERLKMTRDFQGVTGLISFKQGQFYRNLTVLQVKRGVFVKASTD